MKLIESDRKKKRNARGSIISIIFHAGIITLVVFLTATRQDLYTQVSKPQEYTIFIPEAPVEKQPPQSPPPSPPVSSDPTPIVAPPKDLPSIIPPLNMPDIIPPVDLKAPPLTRDDLLKRIGSATSRDSGKIASSSPDSSPHTILEVDVPPEVLPGSPAPRYPAALQVAGLTGEVVAQFVVDQTGKAEMATLRVIRSTHPFFENAVREALPRMRFRPGTVDGKKVRTLVEIPFKFNISR